MSELKHYKMYVNGEFKDSKSGKLLTVINPSTGEKISTVPSATREETQEAIDDAYEAEKKHGNSYQPQPVASTYMMLLPKFVRMQII